MTNQTNYKTHFDEYIKSVFQIENDIRFWKHFLTMSVDKYKTDNPMNRWISESGFSIYNIPPDGKNTWLHSSNETFTIEIDDLSSLSNSFFTWIMNLSLIRMYNSVEFLLLQSIRHKYFPHLDDPLKGKKETNKVVEEIKSFLKINNITVDTKNNRYLITFVKQQSASFQFFCNVSVNHVNWKTTWESFYEFFSILRNVITHHSMLISPTIRNDINSIAGDIFIHYFDQPTDKRNTEILKPKDEHHYLNFISHINDFSGNTVKFIADEQDLNFIGLYR